MGLGDFLFGSKDKIKKQSLLNPDQQSALKNYFQQGIETRPLYNAGSSYLQNLFSNSPEQFDAFQQPYLQNFQQNIIPAISERFAGSGTGAGGTLSSAFANSLAQAGRGLQTDLAAMRGQQQQQGLGQALGYAQQPYSNTLGGLGVNSFMRTFQQGKSGLLPGVLGGIGGGLGGGLGLGIGNSLGNKYFGGESQNQGFPGIGLGGGIGGFGMGASGNPFRFS